MYGRKGKRVKRWLALVFVVAAAAFAAASASPTGSILGTDLAIAKTCYSGYVHAVVPWSSSHRCLRSGQYCKKERNPTYHQYDFQCVDGKLRKQKKGQKK